ncbi:MAG: dephospho-CoA kinase [Elusimicrobiaceae bacterium]|nr:dephospho-CoA kinase [Elusimicrobiaceae bacterium]
MKKRLCKQPIIGLTGGIASGKSTVLTYFKKQGAAVLSADDLVHELYQTGPVRRQLEKWFGFADKKSIAQAVFTSQQKRKKLEHFLHPLVWKRAQAYLANCSKKWVVFEVPLLFEAGWDPFMDLTITVVADLHTKPTCLKARGLTQQAYQKRYQAQWPDEEKIRRTDLLLMNNGSKRQLAAKVKRLYQAFETFYA